MPSTFHHADCGRDGEYCPTGEHGNCPGCLGAVPATAPMTAHDKGFPVAHCPGCSPCRTGHRIDCPCAYSDHRVPVEFLDAAHTDAIAQHFHAWLTTHHLPTPHQVQATDAGLTASVTTLEVFTEYAEAIGTPVAVHSSRSGRTYRTSINGVTIRYDDDYHAEPTTTVDVIDLDELREQRDAEVYAQGTD